MEMYALFDRDENHLCDITTQSTDVEIVTALVNLAVRFAHMPAHQIDVRKTIGREEYAVYANGNDLVLSATWRYNVVIQ